MLGDAEKQLDAIKERANKISSRPDFDGSQLDAIKAAREALAAEREAKRAKVTVGVKYEIIEQKTKYDVSRIPKSHNSWYKKGKPSEKQQKLLLKLGYTQAQVNKMTCGKASDAIDYAIAHPKTSTGVWLKQQKEREAKNESRTV
jgi:hypothetical protein